MENVFDNKVSPIPLLVVTGFSGSGKTTLLRIAAGLELPDSGSVFIDERVVDDENTHVPPENRGIGLVFQDFALFPHLSVLDNVKFGLTALSKKDAKDHAGRILARVGMDQLSDKFPHQLSGGEQQRVALARALAPRPRILLMDEPFSGLDARLRDSIRAETVDLLRDTRSTAIIVTHDPEEALRLCDHIALMQNGRIVQHGTGEEIYFNPNSLFVARFFSELNVFSHVVENGVFDTPVGRVDAGTLGEGTRANICVRLPDLEIAPSLETGGAGKPAQIRSRRFMGVVELIELGIEGEVDPVRIRIKAGILPSGISQVHLRVDPKNIMIFEA